MIQAQASRSRKWETIHEVRSSNLNSGENEQNALFACMVPLDNGAIRTRRQVPTNCAMIRF